MIERLLEVEKMHHGRIFYYLSKNELHVGIDDRKDYLEISLKKPLSQERLSPIISDIALIPAMIDRLQLDQSKFVSAL